MDVRLALNAFGLTFEICLSSGFAVFLGSLFVCTSTDVNVDTF